MLPATFLLLTLASTRLTTLQPSHLVMEGSSTLKRWRCISTSLDARLVSPRSLAEINAALETIAAQRIVDVTSLEVPVFRLLIPVSEIKCGNRLMEREMLHSLRAAEFPAIEFHLKEVVGPVRHESDAQRFVADVTGDLTVAGATRRVPIHLLGWRLTRETFYVRATVPLRMRDFGVTPPTALFGLIRTRNDIAVHFELRLSARPSDESPAR